MKMHTSYLTGLLLTLCAFQVDSIRFYFHGRTRGGGLGEFESNHRVEATSLKSRSFWFDQHLDHFNCSDTSIWKQRYFINDEFYSEGGPVFLMVGGEGEISDQWMTKGAWIDYAKTHKALLFQLEHRFYGQSHPTPDMKVENLQYLSSTQAIEDIAVFIKARSKERQLPVNNRWILFGGSYAGSLVAWAREKYPDLVYGAIASSAPILAVTDFKDYFKVVAEALNETNPNCIQEVAESRKQLGLQLANQVTGQHVVTESFNLCSPINPDNVLDFQYLYITLSQNFAEVVQYNKANVFNQPVNLTIDDVCTIMTDTSIGTASQRLAHLNSIVLNQTNQQCLSHTYAATIKALANTTWGGVEGRQWIYQSCNEFGFFQTSKLDQTQQLFGEFPLSLYEKRCTDLFGNRFTDAHINNAVVMTNKKYLGLDYNTERVVFVHGSVDPWHALGITASTNPNITAIFIKGTAHCADMYQASENDLPQLVEARKKISSIIGDWLRINYVVSYVEHNLRTPNFLNSQKIIKNKTRCHGIVPT